MDPGKSQYLWTYFIGLQINLIDISVYNIDLNTTTKENVRFRGIVLDLSRDSTNPVIDDVTSVVTSDTIDVPVTYQ